MIQIERNVYSGQSYGSWLMVQIRYTRIHFRRWKNRNRQALHVYLAAPMQDPDRGWICKKWGIGYFWKLGRLVFDPILGNELALVTLYGAVAFAVSPTSR